MMQVDKYIANSCISFFLFVLLNLLLIADILTLTFFFEPLGVILVTLLHFLIVFFIQFLTSLFFKKINKNLFIFSIAFFVCLNIFVIKILSYKEIYSNIQGIPEYIIFLGLFFIIYFFIKNKFKMFIYFLIIIGIVNVLNFISSNNFTNDDNLDDIFKINFEQKPDVYLFGIDALAPFSIINETFKSNLSFSADFENHLSRFKNSYGHGWTTKTWASILSLGYGEDPVRFDGSFNGRTQSNLISIFKYNGYKINTGFPNAYFGNSNVNVDSFITATSEMRSTVSCLNINEFFGIRKFYYLCERESFLHRFYNKYILNNLKNFDANLQFMELVSSKILENSTDTHPNLYMYHFLSTKHASSSFDVNDSELVSNFKSSYIYGFNRITDYFNKLVPYIINNKKDSILIFFGDHGLTYYRNEKPKNELQKKLFFNDRYANQIFIYKSNNKCTSSLNVNDQNYNTHVNVIIKVIDCLSNTSFLTNQKYLSKSIIDKGIVTKMKLNHPYRFESPKNYLYE